MARGWESKSVESQQEAAAERARQTAAPVAQHDVRHQVERATLRLARARAEADLQTASAPAHRAMLEQALAELDSRLAALDSN